ncbi:hypothetical protein [Verrucomicrobium sp. BvORR034]|uniref:hypothetical protein n=1 Tax=Verrucomicrobium sp. BvORR034 TaxID=1396418 RepID=UPI000679BE5B|nr:hypothetical protein [Verrucomicrobium sp. BvORR034]
MKNTLKNTLRKIARNRNVSRMLAVGTLALVTVGTARADYTTEIEATATSLSTQATALFAALVPVAGIIAVGAFVVRKIQRGI